MLKFYLSLSQLILSVIHLHSLKPILEVDFLFLLNDFAHMFLYCLLKSEINLQLILVSLSLRTAEFDPRILGLTGPVNSIRQMAQEYRVFFKKVEEDGSDYLVESSHTM